MVQQSLRSIPEGDIASTTIGDAKGAADYVRYVGHRVDDQMSAFATSRIRACPVPNYGLVRLAVAMQLTRLMAVRKGYLDVSSRKSDKPVRCSVPTTYASKYFSLLYAVVCWIDRGTASPDNPSVNRTAAVKRRSSRSGWASETVASI